MPSVVIADDHPLMLKGVAGLLEGGPYELAALCGDGLQARAAILEHRPDVAILDVNMPKLSGLDLLREARAEGWPTRVILLTAGIDQGPLVEAVTLRVDGLVLKDAGGELLMRCIERVLDGEQWIDREAMKQVMAAVATPAGGPARAAELTPRESDVARLVAQGRRNKEIARDLGISEGTVKMHLHNLYEKLDVSSRTELALLVRERQLA
ncbi:MAG: response regulator transcription factor [Phenylobacterium sp.]|uniref:LuxR C-terminal-related transcriptional regulator n=1 Tax=Phenylobacterium sp. TaxID=1871053 RepID=UPI001A5DEE3F|nr:response regulator transcription factor [Phenylobacterium sp.]MBL8770470.1 response regulator transcription factor [Phenylobacterium sp.]